MMFIYAGCPEAEDEIIGRDRCPDCGSPWSIVKRERTFVRDQPADEVEVRCRKCGYNHTFYFNVKGFVCKC
ncbi:MAG: hypothetical protein ACTSU5_13175 [Promethearchaeota archaeon]